MADDDNVDAITTGTTVVCKSAAHILCKGAIFINSLIFFVSLFYFTFFFADWESEAVPKAETLRLIYQGRFLHCNVTLGALGLQTGKTTVMHLVPRDNLPEPNSQGKTQLIRLKGVQKAFQLFFSFLFFSCFHQIKDKRIRVVQVDAVLAVAVYCNVHKCNR